MKKLYEHLLISHFIWNLKVVQLSFSHSVSVLSVALSSSQWPENISDLDVSHVWIIPVCWWWVLLCFSGEEYKPSYYKLGDGDTSVCLATGFSKYRELNNSLFKNTEPVRISEDSLYNQLVFLTSNGTECNEGKNGRFNMCDNWWNHFYQKTKEL